MPAIAAGVLPRAVDAAIAPVILDPSVDCDGGQHCFTWMCKLQKTAKCGYCGISIMSNNAVESIAYWKKPLAGVYSSCITCWPRHMVAKGWRGDECINLCCTAWLQTTLQHRAGNPLHVDLAPYAQQAHLALPPPPLVAALGPPGLPVPAAAAAAAAAPNTINDQLDDIRLMIARVHDLVGELNERIVSVENRITALEP